MSVSRLQNLQGDLLPIAQQYNRTVACTQAYHVAHKDDTKANSPYPDGCFIVVNDDTQQIMNGFVNQMYPVGSVYMNALVDTNPNVLFNFGTWNRITGSFLYAADGTTIAALDTGGASAVTLTQNNLPATATFTIPSLSVTVDSVSTAHTHTTIQTSATTGNVTGSSTSWEHSHDVGLKLAGDTGDASRYGTYVYTNIGGGRVLGVASNNTQLCSYTNSVNLQHSHSITIPTLTTGGMSANETHTHTATTIASSETISDFGSGTAFDIIPPYTALNVWYRIS